MKHYYNENNPDAAAALQAFIEDGLIPAGVVDTRSIEDVTPEELRGFTQCHFFAGIAGWAFALELAGLPPETPLWTGSCPCQPFSPVGRKQGFEDERHLWPVWFNLIEQCRPPVLLGEQSASKDALEWLDLVSTDLENTGYSFGAADLCAAGIDAPHIRQRFYFVGVGNAERPRLERHTGYGMEAQGWAQPPRSTVPSGLRNDRSKGFGFWRETDWVQCGDEKWRPIEPGTPPLASRVSSTDAEIHAAGNAICIPLAATFIDGVAEVLDRATAIELEGATLET